MQVKSKKIIEHDYKGTDGRDLSKVTVIYTCKIIDSEGDTVLYPRVEIPANTVESEIDAALILAVNPF